MCGVAGEHGEEADGCGRLQPPHLPRSTLRREALEDEGRGAAALGPFAGDLGVVGVELAAEAASDLGHVELHGPVFLGEGFDCDARRVLIEADHVAGEFACGAGDEDGERGRAGVRAGAELRGRGEGETGRQGDREVCGASGSVGEGVSLSGSVAKRRHVPKRIGACSRGEGGLAARILKAVVGDGAKLWL